tara:strand:- start:98 stop:526 length:429 start_codon:yes stop_codon:yes gene_type:complete
MNYFKQLKTGDKTFSIEHGVVEVLLVEERDQTLFVTCQTPGECDSEQTTFDAIEGELRAPTWVDELPHLKHCYADYTLVDAVQMVVNNANLHGNCLTNIEEVREYLTNSIRACGHVWITGERALELISAYKENKPITEVAAL